MGKYEIIDKLLFLINDTLKLSSRKLTLQDIDKDLLGRDQGLLARDMMVLYCEIENHFNIKIKEELFNEYGFRTLRNITDLLESNLA